MIILGTENKMDNSFLPLGRTTMTVLILMTTLCLGEEKNDDHDDGSSLDTIFADFTAIPDITSTKKNCNSNGIRKRNRSKPP